MNAWTLALIVVGGWVLASLPAGIFLAMWLSRLRREAQLEHAVDRDVADPKFWERAEADLRRQP